MFLTPFFFFLPHTRLFLTGFGFSGAMKECWKFGNQLIIFNRCDSCEESWTICSPIKWLTFMQLHQKTLFSFLFGGIINSNLVWTVMTEGEKKKEMLSSFKNWAEAHWGKTNKQKKIRKENCAWVNFSALHKRFMAAIDGPDGVAMVYIREPALSLWQKINLKNKTLECSTVNAEQQDCKVYRENVHMPYFKRVIKIFQGFHIKQKDPTNKLPKRSLMCPKAFCVNHSHCNNIKKAAAGAPEWTCWIKLPTFCIVLFCVCVFTMHRWC